MSARKNLVVPGTHESSDFFTDDVADYSINLESGKRTEQTSGSDLKLQQSSCATEELDTRPNPGKSVHAYTSGKGMFSGSLRSPAGSPDGTKVIHVKVNYSPRHQNQLLDSCNPQYEYGSTDVFPSCTSDRTLLGTC